MDFEACYEQYFEKIYRYLFYMTGHRQVAEDLTQESFLKFYKSKFSGGAAPYTYLHQIARNLAYDHYRRAALIKWLPFTKRHAGVASAADVWLLENEERKQLFDALTRLKPAQREVMICRKIEELSLDDTAQLLGLSVVQVANTQRAAMKVLAKMLGGERDEG
ncbi:MAG: RNA polymerase sigma factor [Solibacillus sp.]